jgi:hypothetical protein
MERIYILALAAQAAFLAMSIRFPLPMCIILKFLILLVEPQEEALIPQFIRVRTILEELEVQASGLGMEAEIVILTMIT